MAQSDELTAFYQAYRDWVTAGAPDDFTMTKNNVFGFCRGAGLCANLTYFCFHYGCYSTADYIAEMIGQFVLSELNSRYPFNVNNSEYITESEDDICHLNPKRLKWVSDHC